MPHALVRPIARPIALSLSAFALVLGGAGTAAARPAPPAPPALLSQTFEDGQAPGWHALSWLQPTATTAAARTGTHSLLVGIPHAEGGGDVTLRIPSSLVKVGTWYELYAYARIAPGQPQGNVLLDASAHRQLLFPIVTTTGWTRIGVRFLYEGDGPGQNGYGDANNDGWLVASMGVDQCLWPYDLRVYVDDLTLAKAAVQGPVDVPQEINRSCG